ncbi:MAG: hypothetical protein EA398_12625 [Deltaproteobacteria bacterium]|nr:MAG: hypothetical protein EA398_12625 [Deltaproteobacteria bacterium]
MKLHRLGLTNLNSLRGTHAIDFDRDLGDAPLFLIHGPTGAGKSTLMDAVSLALFACTPRLDNYSASRTDSPSVDDGRLVMSRGTAVAEASLVFSRLTREGRRYFHARWSARRAHGRPDGNLQAVQRSIEELCSEDPEDILTGENALRYDGTSRGQAEEAFAEARGGMGVEDFRRSMLLAQGEFARFLRASPAERAGILERITETGAFREVGARALERWRQERERVAALEAGLEVLRGLDAQERAALEESRHEAAARHTALRTLVDPLRRALAAFEALEAEWHRLLERREAAAAARAVVEASAPDAERLAQHERTREAAAVLARRDAAARAIEALTQERAEASSGVASARETCGALRDEERRARAVRDAHRLVLEKAGPVLDAAGALDNVRSQLATERVGRDALQERRAGLEADLQGQEKQEATAREAARRALAELRALLGEAGSSEALGERLTVERDAAEERVRALAQAREHAERRRKRVGEAEALELERRTCRERVEELEAEREGLSAEVEERREALERARRRERVAVLAADFVSRRGELTAGEPCPLCGSEAHPWAERTDEAEVAAERAEAEAVRRSLEEEVRGCERRVAALGEEVAGARGRLTGLEERLRRCAEEVAEAERALARAWSAAGGTGEWRGEAADALGAVLSGRLEAIRGRKEALASAEKGWRAADEAATVAANALREARQSVEVVAAKWTDAGERVASLEAKEAAAMRALSAAESREGWALGAEEVAVARERLGREAAQADESWAERKEALVSAEVRLASVQERVDGLDRQLRQRREEHGVAATELAGWLERLGMDEAGVRAAWLSAEEARRLGGELAAQRRAADEARALWRDAEAGMARCAREALGCLGEVRSWLLVAAPGWDGAVPWPESLEEEVVVGAERWLTVLGAEEPAPEQEPERGCDEWRDEVGVIGSALGERLAAVEPRVVDARDREVEARTRLADDDRLGEERRAKRAALEEERLRLAVWDELRELIGVGEGQRFRDFAQSLNLEVILAQANVHLARLAGRYRLVQRRDGGLPALDFAVRDAEMAGDDRPITTLSGGESFLCALALALGLAGLRRGRLHLETLLLDEGFGTLDASSLAMAVGVLEQLQATGGVRVGVISHVERLREQIPAQIEVRRAGGAWSTVVVRPDAVGG